MIGKVQPSPPPPKDNLIEEESEEYSTTAKSNAETISKPNFTWLKHGPQHNS